MKLQAKKRLRANEELTPKQEQLDVNGDGEIDSTDLKKLREGEKPVKAAMSADVKKARAKIINVKVAARNLVLLGDTDDDDVESCEDDLRDVIDAANEAIRALKNVEA